MEAIKITVTGTDARVQHRPVLTCGTVGLPVEFTFDESWEGLKKTAVFRVGMVTLDVVDVENVCTVPHELLVTPYRTLRVGVYGTNPDGSLVIPTVWAEAGQILPGADPSGDTSATPTLPVWQQIQKQMVKSVNQVKPDIDGNVQLSIPDAGNYTIKVYRSYDEETRDPIHTTEDFDWDEFQAAVEAGKAVCCRVYDVAAKENDGFTETKDYPLVMFTQEEQYAVFRLIIVNIDEILEIWHDGSVSYERDDLDIYPGFVFAIDNKPCRASIGSSWDGWIHSSYNYLGITLDELGTVVDGAGDDVLLIDNRQQQIYKTDKIQIFGRYMVN